MIAIIKKLKVEHGLRIEIATVLNTIRTKNNYEEQSYNQKVADAYTRLQPPHSGM